MSSKTSKDTVEGFLRDLFIGIGDGADISKTPPMWPGGSFILARAVLDVQVADPSSIHEATTYGSKPIREAGTFQTKCDDSGLASDSKLSSPALSLPKQRPTRPCDLDPDHAHSPSENPNYIRHLDLLLPDHKIRWQGRSKDIKLIFFPNNINYPEKKLKCPKTSSITSNKYKFSDSSKNTLNFNSQFYTYIKSFHYKPLFAQRDSLGRHTLWGLLVCLFIAVDNNNLSGSSFGLNYSRGSASKYGAPFCTDLSGDPADPSPTPRTPSNAQTRKDSAQPSEFGRSRRTASRVFINYKPLKDRCKGIHQQTSVIDRDNNKIEGPMNDDRAQSSDIELDLIWNNDQKYIRQQSLESCGLGGIRPDDQFTVFVDTKRPKQDILPWPSEPHVRRSNKLASGPVAGGLEIKAIEESRSIKIKYLS
ncbi:frequency clock protein-domain-containing protein [Fusarium oxysporum II5]|nr:frequency clock protein-domain-containing protein [Fusarium oxysporum II5]